MKRNKLLIAIAVVLISTMVTVMIISFSKIGAIQEMNRQELHYDADGYFLMLNSKSGLLGIYEATEPIRHVWVNNQFPEGIADGVYLSHYTQNGLFLTTQSSCVYENDPFVLTLENSIEIPEGTPVLVYQR